MEPEPLAREPKHLDFELIARVNLEEVIFEPMEPELHAIDL